MLVSLSVLSTLALLVQSIDAARLPFDAPGSPRSSVQGATELKDVFRQRQARSADIVRRFRQGPSRKRQDPSAAAMCSIPSGTNVVQNPGFESGLEPWTVTSSSLMRARLADGYGYQSATAFYVQSIDYAGTATAIIQQDLTVCAGAQFNLVFDIGRATNTATYNGPECSLVVTIEQANELLQTMYADSPCADGECVSQQSEGGYSYVTFATSLDFTAEKAASPVTFKAEFTCPPASEGQNSKFYLLDNVVLSRASQQ